MKESSPNEKFPVGSIVRRKLGKGSNGIFKELEEFEVKKIHMSNYIKDYNECLHNVHNLEIVNLPNINKIINSYEIY